MQTLLGMKRKKNKQKVFIFNLLEILMFVKSFRIFIRKFNKNVNNFGQKFIQCEVKFSF